jgi:hypothetical protein
MFRSHVVGDVRLPPWLRAVGCFGLTVLAAACGGRSQTSPPPTVSSGHVQNAPVETTSATINRLQSERDSAQQQAAEAKQRAQEDERQLAADQRRLAEVKERDGFERDIATKLDRIDMDLRKLQAEIPRSNGEKKAKLQRAVRDLTSRREAIDRDVRRIHTVPEADWRNFALGIDTRADAIDIELRAAEAGR